VDEISQLLTNLVDDLRIGGTMIHCLHLEDIKDYENNPFAFLSETSSTYTKCVQSSRGNRVRRNQWRYLFSQIKGLDSRFIYEWSRRDKELPKTIDQSIIYDEENDLRISQ